MERQRNPGAVVPHCYELRFGGNPESRTWRTKRKKFYCIALIPHKTIHVRQMQVIAGFFMTLRSRSIQIIVHCTYAPSFSFAARATIGVHPVQ
jgi:hypothetical protein